MRVEVLTGEALDAALDDVARLRISVFRDWPYLYDGDFAYEQSYLQTYRDSQDAVLIGAFDGTALVGAATGTPMEDHAEDFAAPFVATGIELGSIFYCAESVLHPAYRGQGIGHRFFDLREAHAAKLGFAYSAFCAVVRPGNHPKRPKDYKKLDPFWRKRGYAPVPGVVATFKWRDVGVDRATDKPLQFWMRRL